MSDAFPQPPLLPTQHEAGRLEALRRYHILDTPPEAAFDRITALAARLFDMPIALVSLIDESRSWFKSAYGFDIQQVQRDDTICSLALLSNDVLVIADTRQDSRLLCNPFVQNEPGLRFYAGAPLMTPDGFNLGTLCLLDTQPRDPLTPDQQTVLADLAALVIDELELRLAARKVAEIDTALLEITQGVSTSTGEAFFYALVQHLTKTLGVDYAYIGLLNPDHQDTIHTIATCAQGHIIDNFDYRLQDTPCQDVLQHRKLCCYPYGVQMRFPRAPLLEPLHIESYAATPFFDLQGNPLGLLGIMHSQPLAQIQLLETLLPIFALRISTELERQHTEATRHQIQQELEQLVNQRTTELTDINAQLQLEIAERQKTEISLQTEQETLKVLLDNVQAGIVACDADGILTLFNQAARSFHGLPEQPLPPEHWAEYYDLYLPDGKTSMPKEQIPLYRALQGETVDNIEMVIAPKQGTLRTLLASGQAIRDAQGNKRGAVVVMHDITERKQAEAERTQLIREQAARLEAEAEQQRSGFLVEVSTVLASSLDYEQTLQSVAQLAVPYFADWCCVDLLNDDRTISRVAVAHSDPEKVKFGWEIAERFPRCLADNYGISQVMKTGKSEIALEITDEQLVAAIDNAEYLEILRGVGLRSCIIAPLLARDRVLGSISFVFAESNRRYSLTDLRLAEDLAQRAAIAIDNARLYYTTEQAKQSAETAANRIARLQTVTAALSESLTPEQVAEVIVEQSMSALDATAALVVLVSPDRTELEIVKSVGYQADLVASWRKFSIDVDVPLAEAVRTGEPRWMETLAQRIAHYPHLAEIYRRYDFDSWMSLPLVVEGISVGGLLLSFKQFRYLSEGDREFILAISRQCAQAISRAQLYEAERQARAEAERANRVKDEFLAVLSHELRSPLNPILGWSKLLQHQTYNPATLTRGLQTIERNAKLQTQLIEDLLDVSRILRGKLSLDVAPVDLIPTIAAAMETTRLAAEAKAIDLRCIVTDRCVVTDATGKEAEMNSSPLEVMPIEVMGDAGRLQQVIWNLLSNAVKFTPTGGQVEICLERVSAAPTSFAQITVTDTGQGINSDFLPYIFDRFRQADSKTTRKFGGLGLGLAIVQQLVELHGGTVQATSAGEGQGATFTVRLPLLQAKGNPAQATTAEPIPVSPQHPLAGFHILVVDDETDARELLAFILEQAGAIVTAVPSANAALQVLANSDIEVLISDIGMPDVDGYMLMQQMISLFSQPDLTLGKRMPKAIALTAYAGEINQQKAIAAGFQRHFSKPVEPVELIEAIATLVR